MKDIHKNPIFYYILVPAVLALWPLFVGLVNLPASEQSLKNERAQYLQAQKKIKEILDMDPEWLDFGGEKTGTTKFQYDRAVHKVAVLCGIPSSGYELSSRPPRTSKGQTIQTCFVELKQVGIEEFAQFLSTLRLRWPNLQCEKVTLTKMKGPPDAWKVHLDLKYYY